MRLLDISYTTPAENLALDEALLAHVDSGNAPDTVRLWESPIPFVVVGSSQQYRAVVNYFQCRRDAVPILRRCSAGGAVLQGPGCLNYALALSYSSRPEVADLHGSYAYILDSIADALRCLGVTALREGISDLAVNARKISGNAQRRKRSACLHHGTLLYHVNINDMMRYLHEPRDRPDYRGGREHADFIGVLPATADQLRSVVQKAFAPDTQPLTAPSTEELQTMRHLVHEKYTQDTWTYRR